MTDSEKLDLLVEKVVGIDSRLDGMDAKFDRIDVRLDGMDARFDRMDARFDRMEKELGDLKEDVEVLKDDMSAVKLRIENELSPNIQIIAEGHLDLSRQLHEATKPSATLEMLQVKVSILESKVNELERRVPA